MIFASYVDLSLDSAYRRLGIQEPSFGNPRIKILNNCKIDRWKFVYSRPPGLEQQQATADIKPSLEDSLMVMVMDIPSTLIDRLCLANGVYSGLRRFDSVYTESEEIAVLRFCKPIALKPSVTYVANLVANLLEAGITPSYVETIISNAGFDKSDIETMFSETNYKDTAESGSFMREWALKNLC